MHEESMKFKKYLILLYFFIVSLITVHCNNVPVEGIYDNLQTLVHYTMPRKKVIKIDFLWLIDNSSSMCQEQNSLAVNFQKFTQKLSDFSNMDMRLAVTTTDIYSDDKKGCFMHSPAKQYPPACEVNVYRECYDDTTCDDLKNQYGPDWVCKKPQQLAKVLNNNGSVNSYCHKGCSEDKQCSDYFDPDYICNTAPGNEGCLKPPQTTGCPDAAALPTVLDNSNKQYFHCIATVGADQSKAANLESGIKAVWLALSKSEDICDTNNCNVCDLYPKIKIDKKINYINGLLPELDKAIQSSGDSGKKDYYTKVKNYYKTCLTRIQKCKYFVNPIESNFLRDDAYLVIIFISDENDCSPDDGKSFTFEQTKTCSFDTNTLAPVKKYINRFKTLKDDPSKLILVGLFGDALNTGTESCVIPDQCTEVRDIGNSCSCYTNSGSKQDCPSVLQKNMDKYVQLCAGEQSPGFCYHSQEKGKTETVECKNDVDCETSCTSYNKKHYCMKPCSSNDDCIEGYECQEVTKACTPIDNNKLQYIPTCKTDSDCKYDGCVPNCLNPENAALEECQKELSYRLECVDSCFGKKQTHPDKTCSSLVNECACYKKENRDTEKCKSEFKDEFSYRSSCIRSCYLKVKKDSIYVPSITPYICSSLNGMADYGSRYRELVNGFGKHGISSNICSSEGIGASLARIADTIVQIISNICLPKTPSDYNGEYTIHVIKTDIDGNVSELSNGRDYIITDAPECDTKKAVNFIQVPSPDDSIEIIYQAAIQ